MAEELQRGGADVAVKIAGQEFNLRNIKSLNTLATVTNLIGVCLIGYMLFIHQVDAKDGVKEVAAELKAANKEAAIERREASKQQADLLKELGRAAREQNCLIATGVTALPPERRREAAEVCRQVTR